MTEDHTTIRVGKIRVGIVGLKECLQKVAQDYADKGEEAVKEELLGRLKKKNYIPEEVDEEYAGAFWREYQKFIGLEVAEEGDVIMEIKVLGPGCPRCEQTVKVVKEAVAETGVEADVEKISNVMEIAKYGVFGTPAVVIDGEVKSVGKIPGKEEVKEWLAKSLSSFEGGK